MESTIYAQASCSNLHPDSDFFNNAPVIPIYSLPFAPPDLQGQRKSDPFQDSILNLSIASRNASVSVGNQNLSTTGRGRYTKSSVFVEPFSIRINNKPSLKEQWEKERAEVKAKKAAKEKQASQPFENPRWAEPQISNDSADRIRVSSSSSLHRRIVTNPIDTSNARRFNLDN